MTGRRMIAADATASLLAPDPLDPTAVFDGSPIVASMDLAATRGLEIGIWEITPGVVTDTEVDEIFVVLSGRGSVTFTDGEVLALAPGAVVRLRTGERTIWAVTETIRKLYVLLPPLATEKS